jgi:hypothetical protein
MRHQFYKSKTSWSSVDVLSSNYLLSITHTIWAVRFSNHRKKIWISIVNLVRWWDLDSWDFFCDTVSTVTLKNGQFVLTVQFFWNYFPSIFLFYDFLTTSVPNLCLLQKYHNVGAPVISTFAAWRILLLIFNTFYCRLCVCQTGLPSRSRGSHWGPPRKSNYASKSLH